MFRINDSVVFISRMLVRVVGSIIPFLALFVLLIIVFAFILFALGLDFSSLGDDNPYRAIGAIGYFIYVFRTSTGDFDVDPFKDLSYSIQCVIWAFWFVLVFLNTIVFLNFLIAVIGDAYEEVLTTKMESIYQGKVRLIVEMQDVFG